MLTSLSPVGEHSRGQRWWLTTGSYLLASTAGGAAVAGLLGGAVAPVARSLPTSWMLGVLGAAATVGTVVDHVRGQPASWRRQVDERWLSTYRGWVYGAGFGAQLGAGVATIVSTSLTYVVLVSAALSGGPGPGAAIGAAFGLSRALPLVAVGGVRTPARLHDLGRRLERWRPRAHAAARLALAATGVVAWTVVAT